VSLEALRCKGDATEFLWNAFSEAIGSCGSEAKCTCTHKVWGPCALRMGLPAAPPFRQVNRAEMTSEALTGLAGRRGSASLTRGRRDRN
jgi:hypothetical protein